MMMSAQTPGSGTAEEEAATLFRSPEAAELPPLSGAAELAAAAPATRISIAGLPWVDPKRSINFADAGDAQSRSASPAPKATLRTDAKARTTTDPLTIIRDSKAERHAPECYHALSIAPLRPGPQAPKKNYLYVNHNRKADAFPLEFEVIPKREYGPGRFG